MAELKQNVTILLDRLYNLKGEDNVLIRETEERIETVLNRISNIETTIAGAEAELAEQEQGLTSFLQQKSLFETAFEGLTDETFSALTRIDVNLEMGTLLARVQEKSPAFIKGLNDTIEGIKNDILGYRQDKEMAEQDLADLRAQLVVHQEQREQLISLLEQSLSEEEIERESLTSSFVKKVLISFDVFTTDEITKLTKMIIFPEDGLYEYDRGYEERVAKGLIGYVEDEPAVEAAFGSGEDATTLGEVEEDLHEDVAFGEPVSLEESGGIPSILNPNGQIVLDLDEIGTLSDEETVVEEEEVVLGGSDEAVVVEETDETVVLDETVEAPVVGGPVTEGEEEPVVEEEGPAVVLNFQQFQDEGELENFMNGGQTAISEEGENPVEDLTSTETPVVEEVVETVESVEEPAVEEVDTTKVEEFLSRIGLDVNNFSKVNTEPVKRILQTIGAADEELVERNYEILRSINLDDEAYKMRKGHMYITDPDFSKKVTLLRAKNISESKIQSMIKETNSGLRVPFEDMEKRIQSVENLHGKLEEANIYLICKDVSRYEENIDTLLRYGIDIDVKESRNNSAILFESLNIPENVEILKNYLISILKSNGKYALAVFWKKPEELLTDIDDLIEAGLENVIATHPEILGMQASSIIRRVKWCEANGKPVFTDDMRSEPCEYILKADKFRREFDYPTDLPELVDKKQTNDVLVDVIGNSDYIEILMNTLDDYYSKGESYGTPEVIESMKERFEEFSHYLEDNAKAELAGKYTYKIDGVSICKTKLERNIAIILNTLAAAKQPTLGVEREIVLVSALYNSGLTEEELKKVAGACLGFSEAAQEVKL